MNEKNDMRTCVCHFFCVILQQNLKNNRALVAEKIVQGNESTID